MDVFVVKLSDGTTYDIDGVGTVYATNWLPLLIDFVDVLRDAGHDEATGGAGDTATVLWLQDAGEYAQPVKWSATVVAVSVTDADSGAWVWDYAADGGRGKRVLVSRLQPLGGE